MVNENRQEPEEWRATLKGERYPISTCPSYLEPRLVAQISYQEWTADGKLRQPVFLGLRDDKRAEVVLLEEAGR